MEQITTIKRQTVEQIIHSNADLFLAVVDGCPMCDHNRDTLEHWLFNNCLGMTYSMWVMKQDHKLHFLYKGYVPEGFASWKG